MGGQESKPSVSPDQAAVAPPTTNSAGTLSSNDKPSNSEFRSESTLRTQYANTKAPGGGQRNDLSEAQFQTLEKLLDSQTLHHEGTMKMRIPTNRQAKNKVKEEQGEDSLEHKALLFLHQPKVQVFLAVLLALDIVFLFTELALLTFYPHCEIIRRDGISCCSSDDDGHRRRQLDATTTLLWERSLAGSSDDHHYCEEGGTAQFDYEVGCDEHKWHTVHTVEKALYYMTMVILFTFLMELIITMWALKPRVFFRQFFYVLDLFIIVTSITLELVFHHADDDNLQSLSGLLVIGRVWRFVRIGHGLVEITAELTRDQYHVLVEYTRDLELKMNNHGLSLPSNELAVRAREMCVSGPILPEIDEEEEELDENGQPIPRKRRPSIAPGQLIRSLLGREEKEHPESPVHTT